MTNQASGMGGEVAERGSFVLGRSLVPLRNGHTDVVLHWEAVRRPVKVCEGGGWYSADCTRQAWCFRSWMEHKTRPGWSWPSVAEERDNDLDALVSRAHDDAFKRYSSIVEPSAALARQQVTA